MADKEQNLASLVTKIEQLEERHLYHNGQRDFTGINLAGADFENYSPKDVNLSQANLYGAKLSGKWRNNNFSLANLCGANLCGVNLCGVTLRWANLKGAIMPDGTTQE